MYCPSLQSSSIFGGTGEIAFDDDNNSWRLNSGLETPCHDHYTRLYFAIIARSLQKLFRGLLEQSKQPVLCIVAFTTVRNSKMYSLHLKHAMIVLSLTRIVCVFSLSKVSDMKIFTKQCTCAKITHILEVLLSKTCMFRMK